MYENTKTRDAKSEGADEELVDNARPNFCRSLTRFSSESTQRGT